MNIMAECMRAISAVSQKVNDYSARLDEFFNSRCDNNQQNIEDTQNAACELSEEVAEDITALENATCELSEEVDTRIADIENALCELTEEG